MGLSMHWNDAGRVLTLRLMDGSRLLPPQPRRLNIRLVPGKEYRAVRFEGKPVEVHF